MQRFNHLQQTALVSSSSSPSLSAALLNSSSAEVLLSQVLPTLTLYCHALPFPQPKEISIVECPMLKKLPLNSDTAKGKRSSF
ncbi:hypothetical protein V6Z12_D01G018900 [Gossypium hirsutum]